MARKGCAEPPPEPAVRQRRCGARRVGASLPPETYVAFKTHVARRGITGEVAIVEAIERMIEGE